MEEVEDCDLPAPIVNLQEAQINLDGHGKKAIFDDTDGDIFAVRLKVILRRTD